MGGFERPDHHGRASRHGFFQRLLLGAELHAPVPGGVGGEGLYLYRLATLHPDGRGTRAEGAGVGADEGGVLLPAELGQLLGEEGADGVTIPGAAHAVALETACHIAYALAGERGQRHRLLLIEVEEEAIGEGGIAGWWGRRRGQRQGVGDEAVLRVGEVV